ncbi:hypothetical protein MLD38_024414 [Melastoma candidum]|uniref:Uncharacterized protein n=1 Tax=Melastoma candidum TaxID=119954 RepID=A0ACB9NT54_9MYRT|nr:hypothetical protein MLD38_024414 [Melastoma candidum]
MDWADTGPHSALYAPQTASSLVGPSKSSPNSTISIGGNSRGTARDPLLRLRINTPPGGRRLPAATITNPGATAPPPLSMLMKFLCDFRFLLLVSAAIFIYIQVPLHRPPFLGFLG